MNTCGKFRDATPGRHYFDIMVDYYASERIFEYTKIAMWSCRKLINFAIMEVNQILYGT